MPAPLPHLFLSTYACDPDHGSELTVGWNRIVQAARTARVWAVTEDRGQRDRVREALEALGIADRVHVTFLGHDAVERRAMAVPGLFYWAYRRWQQRALGVARRLHAEVGFDLVHHVNMVGYREPGFLHELASEAGLPFVLGPVGGTQDTPLHFLWGQSRWTGFKEAARTVANRVQLRTARRFHAAARRADLVLAATSTGVRDLARVGVAAGQLLETGAPPAGPPRRWADRRPGPLRVLWVGEFVYRKGLHLMLAAHDRLRDTGPDVHLTVVGDGRRRDIVPHEDPDVTWTGWVPRAEVLRLYADADVFAFTSLRDTSGNVMLEALSAGLPVVYVDHQGAHEMGSAACGVPVRVETPAQVVMDLADALGAIGTDPAAYDRMSAAAIRQAERLSWEANGAALWEAVEPLLDGSRASSGDGQALGVPVLRARAVTRGQRLRAALLRPLVAPTID